MAYSHSRFTGFALSDDATPSCLLCVLCSAMCDAAQASQLSNSGAAPEFFKTTSLA
jgi:hypothetical protein